VAFTGFAAVTACGASGGQVERVACYVTNWVTIPRPEQLAVSLRDLDGSGTFGDD
jgi:hypothetical protein